MRAPVRMDRDVATSVWPASLAAHVGRGIFWAVQDEYARARATAGGAGSAQRASLKAAARLAFLLLESLVLFPLSVIPFATRALIYRRVHMRAVQLPNTMLETYAPPAERGDGRQTILFVHGGSWGQGSPWQYSLLARSLVRCSGAHVAVVQYRLFPQGGVDDMVDDIYEALAWSQARAGGDPRRVVSAIDGPTTPPTTRQQDDLIDNTAHAEFAIAQG